MSERDRGIAIAMLAEAFGIRDLTAVRVRVYEQALQKVPVLLLEPMAKRAIQTRQWFPKPAELLSDAEACRVELLRGMVFEPCASCEHSPGWVLVLGDGVARVTRCRCWTVHQERVANLGVGMVPLALPPAQEFSRIGDRE